MNFLMNSNLHTTEDMWMTSVLFRSPDCLEKFKNYLNSKHQWFQTSAYHRPTFSGVYPNFQKFHLQVI